MKMALQIKKFKGSATEIENDATGDSAHSNLDFELEEDETDVKHPRFPAETVQEVWFNVFSKLDPEDKQAFFRAMPEWNSMMTTKSTQFLVPELMPSLLESLPKKTLLQSRLLCKTWTNGLESHIKNHSAHLHFPFQITYEESHPILKHVHQFISAGSIQSFLQEMESHPGNPLIWRNIELLWEELTERANSPESKLLCLEYWNNATLLINTFGRHALFAKIDFTSSSFCLNGLELARIFHSLIDNLPNLKRLSMGGTYLHHTLLIETYFRRNPLPLLPNLEAVDTHSTEGALVTAVINCCCDPKKMKRLKLDEIIYRKTMVYNFSNLEVMSMRHFWPDLQRLRNLEVVPPLREVCLRSGSDFYILGDLFTSLQPFKDTLVSVNCSNASVTSNREGAESMIDLPNLRRLSFRLYEGKLDPLVQLSGSLTHLTIFSSRAISNDEKYALGLSPEVKEPPAKDLVDFYGFQGDMYRSNIWELFPFLISIKVGSQSREFKRNAYEQIQAKDSKAD